MNKYEMLNQLLYYIGGRDNVLPRTYLTVLSLKPLSFLSSEPTC